MFAQKSVSNYHIPVFSPSTSFSSVFLPWLRTPGTQTTWGLLEGKCRSPMSCRRWFILKPNPRTTASTCWAPFKASASAQRRSQGGITARRSLLHQLIWTPVESCDQCVITGKTSTTPPVTTAEELTSRTQTMLSCNRVLQNLFCTFYIVLFKSLIRLLICSWCHCNTTY